MGGDAAWKRQGWGAARWGRTPAPIRLWTIVDRRHPKTMGEEAGRGQGSGWDSPGEGGSPAAVGCTCLVTRAAWLAASEWGGKHDFDSSAPHQRPPSPCLSVAAVGRAAAPAQAYVTSIRVLRVTSRTHQRQFRCSSLRSASSSSSESQPSTCRNQTHGARVRDVNLRPSQAPSACTNPQRPRALPSCR